MANKKIKEEEEEDSLFDRLPDHVLLYILNKVVDGKSLLRCFTVCKRFASVLPHISSATVRIQHHQYNIDGFLSRFNAINSLRVEVPFLCLCRHDNTEVEERIIAWKMELGSKFDNFVILSATSKQPMPMKKDKDGEEEGEEEEEEKSENNNETAAAAAAADWVNVVHSVTRHQTWGVTRLSRLEPTYNLIGNMVITDFKDVGKVIFKRQSLVKLENSTTHYYCCLPEQNKKQESEELLFESFRVPVYAKLWYVPLLRLPSSGYEMKDAHLMMIRRCSKTTTATDDDDDDDEDEDEDEDEDDDDDNIILATAFQDKVSREAVAEILKLNKSATWGEHKYFLDWSDGMWLPNFHDH